jgi:hypothetical protein
MANDLAISANPMRLAQFSYNLIASVVSGIIPLSIRLGQNRKDVSAGREMLAMLTNKMYQARDAYYASITLGMVQVIQFQEKIMRLPHAAQLCVGMHASCCKCLIASSND